MGVVYYSNYFVWFEVGRCDLLRSLGHAYRELESLGVLLPVIEASCEFKSSAHYDDVLEIDTRATLLSPVRVEFCYDVTREVDSKKSILAIGKTVHAAVNSVGSPTRIPEDIRTVLL